MSPYLPDLHHLADLGIAWGIGLVMLLAGSAVLGRRVPPEIRIVAGWGAYALVMTLWGVASSASLVIPAAGFVVLAAGGLLLPRRRPGRQDWMALGRALAVSLPLWLVMAPVRPAEPDTWLNLLPNAVYLVDHGLLPTAARPPSLSFLPAAPYNTQFLSFLGGLADPDFPAGGMSLDNLLLLVAGGLLIARSLAGSGEAAPGWRATALGFLAATLLDPGFVPRINLAAYGETGLAVTSLAAAWLFASARGEREGGAAPFAVAVGLVLAAMVEVKQSGFGLVAAGVAAGAATALLEPGARRRQLGFAVLAMLPPLALFLVWRWFVARAGVAELKPLPFAEWQWANIPEILRSMARTVMAKGFYFGCVLAAMAAFPLLLRRTGWTATTRFLGVHATLQIAFFGFLLLTYIAHFPGTWSTEAHSFYRYETQLTLVLVLALALALRELGVASRLGRYEAAVGNAAVALALAAPVVLAPVLRFDLTMPQPLVWDLAKDLVPYLADGDRLALLLPGDNGSVATMLGGVLNDTAPARKRLDLLTRDRADPATLAEAAAKGYPLAFVSCTPAGLGEVQEGAAALFRFADGEWRSVAVWPYPRAAVRSRWQHILSWRPLCRGE